MSNTHTEELIQTKYEAYQEYIRDLDDEFLAYEYCDRIGNECGELDQDMALGKVINKLEDWCANALYDNPSFNPINKEYKEACK